MIFREEMLGCSKDAGTSLQISGWIDKGKSPEAVRFLQLIQADRQAAVFEFEAILLHAPETLLRAIEGNFIFTYWNAEKKKGVLFKSLLCKYSLYYTSDHMGFSWSRNPLNICSQNYLEAVDKKYLLVACLEDSISTTESYYKEIKRLPAGNLAMIHEGKINLHRIDTLSPIPLKLKPTIEDYVRESRRLIESHVSKRLTGCTKVAVILSGGLDSSVAITSLRKLGYEAVGIHWSFADIPQADESNYARWITTYLQVPLVEIDATDIIRNGSYFNMEWDFYSPYPHPFYRLFEQTLDICSDMGISVCSSGYFGDVIFGPSDPWKVNFANVFRNISTLDGIKWLLEYWQIPKFKTRKAAHERFFFYQSYLSEESKKRIKEGELKAYQREKKSFIEQMMESFDNETDSVLETHLFEKKGIFPFHLFASKELMEFSLHIPLPFKMMPSGGQEYVKPIMRLIYPDMPAAILTRNHRQVMNAFNEWYVVKNKDQILNLLNESSYLAKFKVIDPIKLMKIAGSIKKWASSASGLIRCCMVEIWLQGLKRQGERR